MEILKLKIAYEDTKVKREAITDALNETMGALIVDFDLEECAKACDEGRWPCGEFDWRYSEEVSDGK